MNPDHTRVLFVGEAVSLAHVTRPLVLAQALDSSRYDVYFATGRRYRHIPENKGLSTHLLPTMSPADFYGRIAAGKPVYSDRTLKQYARSELELLARLAPDLVVGDFRISLSLSCGLANIPYMALANAYWSPNYSLGFPVPDLPVTRLMGNRCSKLLMPVMLPLVFKRHAAIHERLRKQWGLAPLGGLHELYTHSDHTCYLDVPSVAPVADLPQNHCYLGPVLWEPDVEWSGPPAKSNGRKRVYLTVGSTGDKGVIGRIGDVLSDLGHDVIPSEADRRAGKLVPGIRAAAVSDLVVCHGGSGTVYQALSQGRPVLGICSNPDQQLCMQGVERAGAGLSLMARAATPETVSRAVNTLLEERPYTLAARRLAKEIECYDAPRRFRDRLEAILGKSPVTAPIAKRALPESLLQEVGGGQ